MVPPVTPAKPAILLSAGLEASRALGSRGVEVIAVAQGPTAVLKASRSVKSVIRAPSTWDERFDEWFETSSLDGAGPILPGNDDAVWWLAARGSGDGPGFDAARDSLVKYRLYERCLAAGVSAPRTWLAEPGCPLPEGPFPMVVKPQTRVGLRHWMRGRLVRNPAELAAAVEWFRGNVRYEPWVLAAEPQLAHPIVQEYVVRPGRQVYHLVGYRSRAGEAVFAAHTKLLQYPMRFGSGLCFESSDVDVVLAAGLERLLSAIGFHGVFEAEFVPRDGRMLLIDLNPRTYNGISLEVARGYNLPWYQYLEAIGEAELLSRELAAARSSTPAPLAWRDSVRFWTMVAGQSVSGGMSAREAARWVRWSLRHRGHMVDPHFARGDLRAGFTMLGQHLGSAFTEPRAFLGTYVRRGLDR